MRKSSELRDKLFSTLDIINNICTIDNRLYFSKNFISYYVVYNEDNFDIDDYIKKRNTHCSPKIDFKNEFFSDLSRKGGKLCEYLKLNYFKMFVVKNVKIVSKDELKKLKKLGKWYKFYIKSLNKY